MIGYDIGAPGGRVSDVESVREQWERGAAWLRDRIDDVLKPVWDLVGAVVETARWVLERVEIVEPVVLDRWETASDERVCPECGPLHGRILEPWDCPAPPLHVNCRCRRAPAITEWRVRQVDEWRLRWTTRTAWEWRITGWE